MPGEALKKQYRTGGFFNALKWILFVLRHNLEIATLGRYYVYRGYAQLEAGGIQKKFFVDNKKTAREVIYLKNYERENLESLIDKAEKDDIFFDVGAHIGYYSVFMSELLENGEVIAFEPYEPHLDHLEKNRELNDSNFRIENVALGDEEKHKAYRSHGNEVEGAAGLHPENTGENTVKVVTGDEYIEGKNLPLPTAMKVDVEGAELDVLRGMERTLENPGLRFLLVEVHRESVFRPSIEEFGGSLEDLQELLKSSGFRFEKVNERFEEFHILAEKYEQ